MKTGLALLVLLLVTLKAAAEEDRRSLRRLAAACVGSGPNPGQCQTCKNNKCTECKQPAMGRGYYPDSKGVCTLCLDIACRTCASGSGACKACLPGYKLTGTACEWATPIAAPANTKTGTFKIPIAPRIQYLIEDGYCAEEALQMTAMYYGVWVPQLWVRKHVGHSLLPGVNYDTALQSLRIDYVPFQDEGYQQFATFAKGWLKAGVPVIAVSYIPDETDPFYDHVEPLIGITTKSTKGYDANDVYILNTGADAKTITRKVGDFHATRKGCKKALEVGGCIPDNTVMGYAVKGTTYGGIRVELTTTKNEEPTVAGKNDPAKAQNWPGKATMRGLTAGKAYTLYKFTQLGAVPQLPTDVINGAGAAWSQTFTATGPSQTVAVNFDSGTPAYFIAVAKPF